MKALKLINESKNHMNDKELLLEAIDNYTQYTLAQRTVLKTLVSISINNIVKTNAEELSKISGITKATIYSSLKLFLKEGIIEKIEGPNRGIGIIKLISSQLDEIQKIFLKKIELLKK